MGTIAPNCGIWAYLLFRLDPIAPPDGVRITGAATGPDYRFCSLEQI